MRGGTGTTRTAISRGNGGMTPSRASAIPAIPGRRAAGPERLWAMPDASVGDFAQVAERYRSELQAYCYRMLGSVDESEDLVQDTYLRAWQSYDRFEGRSSVRLWLYKIATNTYLNALQARRRRPLPSGLSAPADSAAVALAPPQSDIPWLQPAPDSMLFGATDDPAVVVSHRSTVRLAFVAALQHLSPLQRAVLV